MYLDVNGKRMQTGNTSQMIFNIKKHSSNLYNTLLYLSRNTYFYNKIYLKDTFETRIYLMFMHFSLILIIFKIKKSHFPQNEYDSLFYCIENNLRELGVGDVGVNKRMKELNKVFYDILLKIKNSDDNFKINKRLVLKYFKDLETTNDKKYGLFDDYFTYFYNFCFDINPKIMIQEAIKFKVK